MKTFLFFIQLFHNAIPRRSGRVCFECAYDRKLIKTIPLPQILAAVCWLGLAAAESSYGANNTVIAWSSSDMAPFITAGAAGVVDATAIAAGDTFGLALRSNGTIVAWGDDTAGRISVPSGLTNVTAIAAGGGHGLALKSDSTVVAWGLNDHGQATVPVGLTNVTAIAAGKSHSLALRSNGTVVAWGDNSDGQTNVPAGLANVVAIASGNWGYHNLALRANGTVIAWGDNSYGQTSVPAGLANVTAIAAGNDHSLALKADGKVVGWGDDRFYQATGPAAETNVMAISASEWYSMVLRSNGTVGAYGWSRWAVPGGLTNVVAISAGAILGLALYDGSPAIVSQPASLTTNIGGTVAFSVSVWGTSPFGYQWRHAGTNLLNNSRISGTTGANLIISAIQTNDAGGYSVVVTNARGSAISDVAILSTTNGPPCIITQPGSLAILSGGTASFTVAAAGAGSLNFQWCRNGTNLVNGGNISGVTTTNLVVSNVQFTNCGSYTVVVTNIYGSVTSAVATLILASDFIYRTNNGAITITGYTGTNPVVVIPNTINGYIVVGIGDGAFRNCGLMTSITISDSVTNIGNWAFQYCYSLTNFTISSSVSSFGGYMFTGCYGLNAINVSTQNTNYCSVDGVMFNKNQTTLVQYPPGKDGSYTIPNSVNAIGSAFYSCYYLTSVTIPNSINNIDALAFEYCSSLTDITIPDGVTNIGASAFRYCSSLTSVTIPGSVTNIGNYAFQSCSDLKQAYFQGKAPSVNGGAGSANTTVFQGETGTVYYVPGTTGWGATFGGWPVAVWQPQMQLAGGSQPGTNGFGFNINWASGQSVVVETRTNLVGDTWVPLQTNTLGSAPLYFSDPRWTNYPARFYRLRSQ